MALNSNMARSLLMYMCGWLLVYASAQRTAPEQIAIAATGSYSSVVITWVTFDPTEASQVQFGVHGSLLSSNASGTTTKFVEGVTKSVRYIHRATLTGLQPLQKYDYHCGCRSNWSKVYTFTTLGEKDSSPTFAVYGDFGAQNAQSLPWLVEEATQGSINGVLHCGDIAYNLFGEEGRRGDQFMNQIQAVATQVPYMVAPGNHEWLHNFSDYKNRFSMPGNTQNYYYSWDAGPAHIISFSTELYFFLMYGLELIPQQYHWLEEDLKRATSPEQRAKHPWIITMAHHPMYCTTTNGNDCDHYESVVRVGLPLEYKYGLEKLFYDYGVDLTLWGHEHIYERLWPLYNHEVMNGSYEKPYTNPKAPVHIVTGSAGCREKHSHFQDNLPDWVAFTSSDYGYTKLTIYNSTHLSIEQISTDQGGKVIDSITVVKDTHGTFKHDKYHV